MVFSSCVHDFNKKSLLIQFIIWLIQCLTQVACKSDLWTWRLLMQLVIGRLVNAVLSAFHHRARLVNMPCFNVVRRLFGKLASTRSQIPEHGASRHKSSSRRHDLVLVDCKGQEIMYLSAVGRLVHTVFHLEARPVSECGMFERSVQPHQNSAFLLAVLSVILSDEGDVGQVTYV
jgi:hypothetical protein